MHMIEGYQRRFSLINLDAYCKDNYNYNSITKRDKDQEMQKSKKSKKGKKEHYEHNGVDENQLQPAKMPYRNPLNQQLTNPIKSK